MSDIDTCSINPNGGQIKITIKADNGVRSASKFALAAFATDKWEIKESLELVTGDRGEDSKKLIVIPADVNKNRLAWKIISCGLSGQISNANFTVEIWQDGKMKFTSKVQKSIPKCSDGEGLKFGSKVEFNFNPA